MTSAVLDPQEMAVAGPSNGPFPHTLSEREESVAQGSIADPPVNKTVSPSMAPCGRS